MDLLRGKCSILRVMFVLFLVLTLCSCSAARSIIASFHSTEHFRPLSSDSRIFYEPGAEANALEIKPLLSEAITAVQKRQYNNFIDPVEIYVCESTESYRKLTGSRGRAVVTRKLFLSPRLFQDRKTLPLYLTHELSHLHLLQRIGMYRSINLPSWFKEGLATYVSGGGGATDVTDEQAITAINSGHSFVPDEGSGIISSFLFPRYGNYWKLDNHMFYRQCMLFVAFMQKTNENSFRNFLISVENGKDFSTAFANAYSQKLSDLWAKFAHEIKEGPIGSVER